MNCSYNEHRADPPLEWNHTDVIGRIRWARSLFNKMDTPMKAIKDNNCVIEHRKAQLCVKYYNYMSSVLLHYEMLYSKAFNDYVEQVRNHLEIPVFGKNIETNRMYVNMSSYVPQLIRETESMWKLGLQVHETAAVLTYCKHKVLDAAEQFRGVIQRNDKLRM